ncbi:MAG: ribulose-phosphate 3-epimerase [Spirochaetes bacterium]|nr:ribulose-phosphate 3-epimerase [Spirochaetota bacterium]
MLEKEKSKEIDFSKICPSIFAANFLNLKESLNYAKYKGVKLIHLDIMDGHFVPNISFGPKICEDILSYNYFNFDAHLMIENPEKFIPKFMNPSISYITIHYEIKKNIVELINQIKLSKVKAGISIKPKTSFEELINFLKESDLLHKIDLILIMSVEPGFSGQKFIDEVMPKIKKAYDFKIKNNLNYIIQVDGGINFNNCYQILDNGADLLVMGANFFK